MFKWKNLIYCLIFISLIIGCGKGTILTEDEDIPDYTAPTITRYGTSIGDRMIGTFTAYVSGNRTTSGPGVSPILEESLHGTITGLFDVEIISNTGPASLRRSSVISF